MAPRTLRLALSFIVGLGCWFGRVEAQAPAETQVTPVRGTAVVGHVAAAPFRHDGAARDCLNRNGYACGQNHNWYGCGGWRAQCTFVFGSCRTFFGEPCMPRQPRETVNVPGSYR